MDHPPTPAEFEEERRRRLEAERALAESTERYERLLNTIPCALYDYIRWPDGGGRFVYISPRCKDIFGYEAGEILASRTLLWDMVHPEDVDRLRREDAAANRAQRLFQSEVRVILPSGETKWVQLTSMPGAHEVDSQTVWSGVILDVTRRKRAEEEKDKLVLRLQRTLADVKTLKGLLPICAHCKKIRDDRGYWNQIESYISRHSETEFSHGICPECAETFYPELYPRKKDGR